MILWFITRQLLWDYQQSSLPACCLAQVSFNGLSHESLEKNLQCFYFVTISIFFPDPFPHLFSQPVSFAHIDFVSFCFAILSVANIFYQALLTLHFYLRLVFKFAFSASYVIFSSSFCNFLIFALLTLSFYLV